MRIALVNDHYATLSPGGQHRIQNLGLGLLRLGHDVIFISPVGVQRYEDLPHSSPSRLAFHRRNQTINWAAIWHFLRRELRCLDLVVFELPMPVTKGFPIILTKLNRIPTVVDFGDIWFSGETHSELLRRAHDTLYREICRVANLVTTPTNAMAQFLREFTGASVLKLPYPVDTRNLFNPQLYPDPGLGGEVRNWRRSRKVVVYSGTLSLDKGCDQIPVIAKRVIEAMGADECGFLVVGDGPQRSAVQKRIQDQRMSDCFLFERPESVRDVPRLVSVGSVALALSPASSIPFAPRNVNKMTEYLAMGKPIVAIRDANSVEYVENEKTGSLTDLGGLPNTLLEMLNSPQKLKGMASAARSRAESDYACDVVAAKLLLSGIAS